MWLGDVPAQLDNLTLPERLLTVLLAKYFPSAYTSIVKLFPKHYNARSWDRSQIRSALIGNVSTSNHSWVPKNSVAVCGISEGKQESYRQFPVAKSSGCKLNRVEASRKNGGHNHGLVFFQSPEASTAPPSTYQASGPGEALQLS